MKNYFLLSTYLLSGFIIGKDSLIMLPWPNFIIFKYCPIVSFIVLIENYLQSKLVTLPPIHFKTDHER